MYHVATLADPGLRGPVVTRTGLGRLYASCLLVAALLLLQPLHVGSAIAYRPCEAPPAAVKDLDVTPPALVDGGKPSSGEIEPLVTKRPVPPTAVVARFLEKVVTDADRAWAPVRAEVARRYASCAITWLEAWARDSALLGTMRSRQAEIRREYDFAGLAVAYLKVRARAEAASRKVIETWLVNLADAVQAAYDKRRPQHNHRRYWLALALGAVGVGADSERHWNAARAILAEATRAIDREGMLAAELARKDRALHYHAFALTPLVVLAELAAARGDDVYAVNDGALHRLVAVVSHGLFDPALFERRAGAAQDGRPTSGWGWLPLYTARFPERAPKPLPDVPSRHVWIGGDAQNLARALAPGT